MVPLSFEALYYKLWFCLHVNCYRAAAIHQTSSITSIIKIRWLAWSASMPHTFNHAQPAVTPTQDCFPAMFNTNKTLEQKVKASMATPHFIEHYIIIRPSEPHIYILGLGDNSITIIIAISFSSKTIWKVRKIFDIMFMRQKRNETTWLIWIAPHGPFIRLDHSSNSRAARAH